MFDINRGGDTTVILLRLRGNADLDHLRVQDLMITRLSRVQPEARCPEIARAIMDRASACAFVVDRKGKLLGMVTGYDLARAVVNEDDITAVTAETIMTPAEKIITVGPELQMPEVFRLFSKHQVRQLPVIDRGRLLGLITRDVALALYWQREAAQKAQREADRRASTILRSLHEGLIVVDRDLVIREFNPAAERLVGKNAIDRIGSKAEVVSVHQSPIFEVLETGEAKYNIESQLRDGRVFIANYVPIVEGNTVTGVIQTFTDVTEHKQMERQLIWAKEELEKAFALTLPNSRVEHKLKTTPEYHDAYDPATGLIRITGVIPDGNYAHVVNCLKVAADLNERGIMGQIGIDKDILVQAIIFHDLGKSQPDLEIGAVVDPRVVFEDGRQHAARSADLAGHFYHHRPEVIELIRYHHHSEEELPPSFPGYLLPMLRLFKVVDGLSACLTRRDGKINIQVNGSRVIVSERNGHPDYNCRWGVNLLTGERWVFETYAVPEYRRQMVV